MVSFKQPVTLMVNLKMTILADQAQWNFLQSRHCLAPHELFINCISEDISGYGMLAVIVVICAADLELVLAWQWVRVRAVQGTVHAFACIHLIIHAQCKHAMHH